MIGSLARLIVSFCRLDCCSHPTDRHCIAASSSEAFAVSNVFGIFDGYRKLVNTAAKVLVFIGCVFAASERCDRTYSVHYRRGARGKRCEDKINDLHSEAIRTISVNAIYSSHLIEWYVPTYTSPAITLSLSLSPPLRLY